MFCNLVRRHKAIIPYLLFTSVFVFVVALGGGACGGSGGSGGSSGGLSVRVNPGGGTMAAGTTITFSASTGGAMDGVAYSWQATQGTITSISSNSASYTAPPGVTQIITITATNTTTSQNTTINITVDSSPNQGTVTGNILRSGSTAGLDDVVIKFYNNLGNEVSSGRTVGTGGGFTAVVSDAAVTFHIVNADNLAALNGYHKVYTYNALRYNALDISCKAPLPTVTAGLTTGLLTDITFPLSSSPPPPPPDGCTQ